MLAGLAQLGLALTFIAAGVMKAVRPGTAGATAAALGVPERISRVAGTLFPALEIVLGLALLVEALAIPASAAAVVLLAGLTLLLTSAIHRGRRPPCQCFGSFSQRPIGWRSIVRNVLLAGAATLVLTYELLTSASCAWSCWSILWIPIPDRLLALLVVLQTISIGFCVWAIVNLMGMAGQAERQLAVISASHRRVGPPGGTRRDVEVLRRRPEGEHAESVVLFTHSGCTGCHRLLHDLGNNPSVRGKRLVIYSDDPNIHVTGATVIHDEDHSVAAAYGVTAFPAVLDFNRQGEELSRAYGYSECVALMQGIAPAVNKEPARP